MKVLHVINSMTIGGAEVLLANSLSKGGLNEYIENHLVYLQGASSLLERVDENVKKTDLKYKGIFDLPRTLLDLREIIKANKIDIVHSHLNPGGLYTHLACPKNVPHVHTLHAPYSLDTETSKKMLWLEKNLYFKNRNSQIICVSDFTKDDFVKALSFKGKTYILNNFVADDFFNGSVKAYNTKGHVLRIAAAGTLKELKNFEYLLEVLTHLKQFDISLDIYGNGDSAKYKEYIALNKINARMMGVENDIAAALQKYDLFMVPSKFESFSLCAFEAMASGLPLMISDIKPLKNIVQHNAIYFQLDNAKETAALLLDIFYNKIDIYNMAIKAKAYAEKTVRRDIYIKNLLEIYKQVLAG